MGICGGGRASHGEPSAPRGDLWRWQSIPWVSVEHLRASRGDPRTSSGNPCRGARVSIPRVPVGLSGHPVGLSPAPASPRVRVPPPPPHLPAAARRSRRRLPSARGESRDGTERSGMVRMRRSCLGAGERREDAGGEGGGDQPPPSPPASWPGTCPPCPTPGQRSGQRLGLSPPAAGADKTPQEPEQHRPSCPSRFPSLRHRTFLRRWVSQDPPGRR